MLAVYSLDPDFWGPLGSPFGVLDGVYTLVGLDLRFCILSSNVEE